MSTNIFRLNIFPEDSYKSVNSQSIFVKQGMQTKYIKALRSKAAALFWRYRCLIPFLAILSHLWKRLCRTQLFKFEETESVRLKYEFVIIFNVHASIICFPPWENSRYMVLCFYLKHFKSHYYKSLFCGTIVYHMPTPSFLKC